jgi:hypothetical protein
MITHRWNIHQPTTHRLTTHQLIDSSTHLLINYYSPLPEAEPPKVAPDSLG